MPQNAPLWTNSFSPADQDTRREQEPTMAKATAPVSDKSDKSSDKVEKDTPRPIKRELPQPAEPPRDPARDSALVRAVQQIEKQFGKGAVMRLDSDHIPKIDGIP